MVTLAFLIAACLDPVQATLVFAFVLAYRGPQSILITGAAAAVVSETVMLLAADGYVWGELIAPRLVAALLQATVLVAAVGGIRAAATVAGRALGVTWLAGRDRADALQASPPAILTAPRPGHGAQPDAAPGSGAWLPPRRLALWHMRSYARRRIMGLRFRKIHP